MLLALFLLAACSPAELDESAVSSTTQPDGPTTTGPQRLTTTVPGDPGIAVPDEVVEAAIEQAAEDTEFDPERLQAVSAQQVVWNDGSLGCPQEGQSYIQVLTDGYWVILESPRGELDYRATLDGDFRGCQDGQPPHSTRADR